MICAFIDEHKQRFGVVPICRALEIQGAAIAPRTYWAHRSSAPSKRGGADLLRLLKTLKLGALADTLPERAALARQHKLSHIGFLETLLADEVSRRESRSAALRATKAGLDPSMRFDTWTAHDDLRYDRTLLGDLTSLRFLDAGQSAIILGPVGVGKTRLATALGNMAIRRRHAVLFGRADKLFTRLRAARLDNTVDAEIRRLAAVEVLIIDDFALRPLDATETSDFYNALCETTIGLAQLQWSWDAGRVGFRSCERPCRFEGRPSQIDTLPEPGGLG